MSAEKKEPESEEGEPVPIFEASAEESGAIYLSDGPDPQLDRPKKRKRGGLRVPSDNVPRPQAATSTPAVTSSPTIIVSLPPVAAPEPPAPQAAAEPELEPEPELVPDPEPEAEPEPAVAADVDAEGVDVDVDVEEEPPAPAHASASADHEEELADDDLVEERASAPPPAPVSTPPVPPAPVSTPPVPPAPVSTPPVPPAPPVAVAAPAPAATSTPPAATSPSPLASTSPPPAQPAPAEAVPAPVAAAPSKRRKSKPWHEEVFDEDYLRTLPFLTPQATQREVDFLLAGLNVTAGQQLLDIGCGHGRHALDLASRGYLVTAVDSSLALLRRGAEEGARRGLSLDLVHGDMREMAFEAQFDGAYCVFSTFGYFDDDVNKRVLQAIARALRPGARFVLDVLNRDYIVADLPTRVWWEGDGCVVLEEVDFNYFSSRVVNNRSIVFEGGRQLDQEISIRAYSLHELGRLLHNAGFRVIEVSGSMSTPGHFFGSHSRSAIIVAEKRPPGTAEP